MVIIEDTRQQSGKHDLKHTEFTTRGVELVRCKLPFGDYAPIPPVSVDTKRDMEEIAGNICGAEHARFIRECKAAQAAGCQLVILVENTDGIRKLSDVHKWVNPRSVYSPKCVQGSRLQKAMETITERYGVVFLFCTPQDAAKYIVKIMERYERQSKPICGTGLLQ